MRKTKKMIYAEHGIEYDPKTGKILSPMFGGMWINPLLVNGNTKIGKGAYHFSTLAGNIEYNVNIAFTQKTVTAKKSGKLVKVTVIDDENPVMVKVMGTCPCVCRNKAGKIACYAMGGNYQYATTKAYLAIRTLVVRECMDFAERAIKAQIKADKIRLCRIHASGDFFSVEYAEMWKRIVNEFQNVTFWTYTKNKACEHAFDGMNNANIVKSFLPNGKMNFGHCDHIMRMYKLLKESGKKVHICFCGIEEYAGIPVKHCTDCHSCAENEYVLFVEHSTEYKAENDPLFPELVRLILSQSAENAAIAA